MNRGATSAARPRTCGRRSAGRRTPSEQNGVALVARYGFAGPEQWQQLDTSLNTTPDDTMWVLRVPVCLDAACSQSMPVYVTHWYGTGANSATSYASQAQQTVGVPQRHGERPARTSSSATSTSGKAPRRSATRPRPTARCRYLRSAGYLDAWLTLQGSNEGFTGMANRAGCGFPEGNTWKRIDYAWTLPSLPADRHPALRGDAGGRRVSLRSLRPRRHAPEPVRGHACSGSGSGSGTRARSGARSDPPRTGAAPTPAPAPAPATSVWTSLVKAAATGATLQKTSRLRRVLRRRRDRHGAGHRGRLGRLQRLLGPSPLRRPRQRH